MRSWEERREVTFLLGAEIPFQKPGERTAGVSDVERGDNNAMNAVMRAFISGNAGTPPKK